ncbi:MAG TPA: PIN domain-containing protein [Pyrinomonadaceae bacterium]|nr:PIN domain-containing protein [Pyrinomonadaceae bacterium]
MNAVDTNVLLYVHDYRAPAKQAIAKALVDSLSDVILLWQVACEYIAASRKFAPLGYSSDKAWQDIRKLRALWTVQVPVWEVLEQTEVLMRRYSLSSWDALLVAACLDAGVTRLYTEDFGDSLRAEGLEVINPFAAP